MLLLVVLPLSKGPVRIDGGTVDDGRWVMGDGRWVCGLCVFPPGPAAPEVIQSNPPKASIFGMPQIRDLAVTAALDLVVC